MNRFSRFQILLIGGAVLSAPAAFVPHDATNNWNVAEGDAAVAANYLENTIPGANAQVRIANGGTMSIASDLSWGALWAGYGGNAFVRQTAGHLTLANPGNASGDGSLWLAYNPSNFARYDLTGGLLEVTKGNPQIGRSGVGLLAISGGEAIFSSNSYPSIGRIDGASGHIDLSSTGTLTASSVAQFSVGEQGLGTLTVRTGGSADVSEMILGVNSTGAGTLNVCSGGVLKVAQLYGGQGTTRRVNALGGTIRAKTGGGTRGFLSNTEVHVGPGALRFDTDGHDAVIASPLRAGTISAADLVHRWSFNGTLADSIGGQTAVLEGSSRAQIGYEENQLRLPGASHEAAYVSLGAGIIPSGSEGVTVEIWLTPMGKGTWSRVFTCHGKLKTSEGFVVLNSNFHRARTGEATAKTDGVLGAFDLNRRYHLALRFTRQTDGAWTFEYLKRDALTGGLLKRYRKTDISSDYEPADFSADCFNLGWSTDSGNDDANIRFDEVRVWKRALTDDELVASATLGPDADFSGTASFVKCGEGQLALAAGNDYAGETRVEAGQLLAASTARPVGRWSFNGSYADSIAERAAVPTGSRKAEIVLGETCVTLPGATHQQAHLKLGSDVWANVSDAFTLEFWAKQNEAHTWARLFTCRNLTYATAKQPRLFMTLVDNKDPTQDIVGVQGGDTDGWTAHNRIAPWTLGEWFHVAVVGRLQADGTWQIGFRKHDVATGECLKTYTGVAPTGWSPTQFNGGDFGLGWSTDGGNDDAAASFDEVRVWARALTDDELTLSTKLGPDLLPTIGTTAGTGNLPTTTDLVLAEGASFALAGATQTVRTVSGSGTVQGCGTLTVTESVRPGGADAAGTLTLTAGAKIVGPCVFEAGDSLAFAADSTYDVSQIKIQVVDPARIVIGSPVTIMSAAGATLTGSFDVSDPSMEGLRLRVMPSGRIRLSRQSGAVMFLR